MLSRSIGLLFIGDWTVRFDMETLLFGKKAWMICLFGDASAMTWDLYAAALVIQQTSLPIQTKHHVTKKWPCSVSTAWFQHRPTLLLVFLSVYQVYDKR